MTASREISIFCTPGRSVRILCVVRGAEFGPNMGGFSSLTEGSLTPEKTKISSRSNRTRAACWDDVQRGKKSAAHRAFSPRSGLSLPPRARRLNVRSGDPKGN